MITKSEREELRRLLRARFKLLRTDVAAREVELQQELDRQVTERYAVAEKRYDEAMFAVQQALDEANRKINDVGRELHGADKWGLKHDRRMVALTDRILNPAARERHDAHVEGAQEIKARVKKALLSLEREETQLLTELATTALESTESRAFFDRIPTVSELVPAYRMKELS